MASNVTPGIPDWHSMTIAQILALPPEAKQQILLAMAEEKRRKNEEQQKQADELAKGPTPAQTAVGAIGPPAALAGGLYLANHSWGTPAATAAATQGTAAAGQLGAAGAAGTGALPSAAGAAGAGAAANILPSGLPAAAQSAINMPGSAAELGGALAANTAAQGGALSGLAPAGSAYAGMGTLSQVALPIGAALGAYHLGSNLFNEDKAGTLGGAASGAGMGAMAGSMFGPGPGTLIGAGIGGLAGAILGNVGHGPNFYEQEDREKVQKGLKGTGFLSDTGNLDLPGGSFQIGTEDKLPSGDFRFNTDQSRGDTGGIIGAVNPLAALLTGGDEKLTSDFAGYFTNAAQVGGDPGENIRAMYQKAGLDYNTAMAAIDSLKIPDAQKRAYQNGINQLFGQQGYKGPQSNFMGGSPPSGNASSANDLKGPGASPAISSLLQSGQGPKPGPTLPQIGKKVGGMVPQWTQLGAAMGRPNGAFGDAMIHVGGVKTPMLGTGSRSPSPQLLPSGQGPTGKQPNNNFVKWTQPDRGQLLPSGQGPTGGAPMQQTPAQDMAKQLIQFGKKPDPYYNRNLINRYTPRQLGR